ncbi:hypothetical protein H4S06_004882, partial [Coemansia sp. BCRC 34490]
LGVGSELVSDEESLAELLRLPLMQLTSDSWANRIQSAKTIVELAQMVERASRTTELGSQMSTKSARLLEALAQTTLPELIRASQGRLWPGKENTIGALVKVCGSCARIINKQTAWMEDDSQDSLQHFLKTVPQTVCTILLKEVTIGETSYRREVAARFISFVEAVPIDIYDKASSVLIDIARTGMAANEKSANAMDVDVDDDAERSMRRPQQLLLVAVVIKALQTVLPKDRLISIDEAAALSHVLCGVAETGVWNTRVASLACIAALYKNCSAAVSSNSLAGIAAIQDLLDGMNTGAALGAIRTCATEGKYVTVRTAALDAAEAILGCIKAVYSSDAEESSHVKAWQRDACTIVETLAEDSVPSISDRARDVVREWTRV